MSCSLGVDGAVASKVDETFIAKSPKVNAISVVGSGDCILAGLVRRFLKGLSFKESVVCGVAAETVNTLTDWSRSIQSR